MMESFSKGEQELWNQFREAKSDEEELEIIKKIIEYRKKHGE